MAQRAAPQMRLALAATLVLAPLAAQGEEPGDSPKPQWITGRVIRADGTPWRDALVTLHSRPWGLPVDESFAHRVTVRSNEDGLFRAPVRPGRGYSAWAQSEIVEGRYTASAVADGVSAGQPVRLEEDEEPRRVVKVRVQGLRPWAARAPFSFDVMCMLGNRFDVACAIDKDGDVTLPPLPVPGAYFRVRDVAGAAIAGGTIPLGEKRRRELSAAPAEATGFVTASVERTEVQVPPPVELRVALRGPGGPAVGAQLQWTDRADRRTVTEAGRGGVARLLVPAVWLDAEARTLEHLSFWIDAPRCATVNWFASGVPVDQRGGIRLTLPRGNAARGRLLWSKGRPAARAVLLLHTGVPGGERFDGMNATFGGAPRVFWTDDKGRFRLEGLAPHVGWQLSTFLREGEGEGLPRSSLHPLAPRVVLAAAPGAPRKLTELGNLVLDRYRPIDVTVTTPDGQPAVGVDLHYRERLEATFQEERVARLRADWQGRIRLLARPGSTGLLAFSPDGEPRVLEINRGKAPLAVSLTAPPPR